MNINYKLVFLLLFPVLFVFEDALESPRSSSLTGDQQEQKRDKAGSANIVLKSTDGGQTWLEIGDELRDILQGDGIRGADFFTDQNGLFLRAENDVYYSKSNSIASFWKKQTFHFPVKHASFFPGKTGIIAYNSDGQFLQKKKESSQWLPVYKNFQGKAIRTVFETARGTVLIGTNHHLNNNQLFRSTNNGKTWKQVPTGNMATKIVESNGVLLATGAGGILRSTDDGATWHWAIKEGAVGIDVELINRGFAAITYGESTNSRRVRTSYDGGVTWQRIDAGLPAHSSISSIIQVGEYFFCGHPDGIFRSGDNGKTWKLIVPAVEGKVYSLFVSGNVVYAIPRFIGC